MARPKSSNKPKGKKNANRMERRAQNAFNIAVDDEEYITGTRQQQDIDLEEIADKRINDLLDGKVKEEDDEDLDSDELLGDGSDYEMFDGEPEFDWGDSVDEDELVPLSAALDMASDSDDDMDDDDDSDSKPIKATKTAEAESSDSELGDDSEADSESEDGERDDSEASESDSDIFSDNESDSDLDDTNNFALQKAIKKITDSSVAEKAKLDKYAVPENPNLMPSRSTKLSLDDLTSTSNGDLKLLKGKAKAKALDIPLPERIKARGDREAAYELAKKEVSKWDDAVEENRRAEHLTFPINAPPQREQANPLVPNTEANALEATVEKLLVDSHIKDEKNLSAFEEVAPTKLTFEEMKKRRDELRMMRELMFREEVKAKRIKKIKSKSYRRVHKKERLKQEDLMREAGMLGDEDPEEASRQRALERASLKHKSTSKWAKRMIDSGMTKDASTRAELDAMLQHGDSLRQKVLGDGDESSDDEDILQLRDESDQEESAPKKGLMGMKFMQAAEKREKEANRRLIEGSDSEPEILSGRRAFGPASSAIEEQAREAEKRAQEEAELDDEKIIKPHKSKKQRTNKNEDEIELRYNIDEDDEKPASKSTDDATANPWLTLSAPKNQSTFESIDKDSSKAAKTASKLSKAKGKKSAGADVEIDIDAINMGMVRKDQLSFEQKDLIRKAFAGDDVVAEFEAEKEQIVEDEGDKEVDETLPGWGSWGGEGLKPKVQRFRKIKGVDAHKRKDYKKDGVIINEKINKKNSKYSASAVPFPYENAAQYERSLQTPLGNEWATRDTFQRQTKPRVMVKKGEIIDPLKLKGK